jgi:tRNA dimethylallyltransferase
MASLSGGSPAAQSRRYPAAPAVAIVGATASGKSAATMALAEAWGDVEIVSADALQVYRGMDVGTAKPTAAERAAVAHHVIDVADPAEEYSLARYVVDARAALADIADRGRGAVVVGGTGLYVRGVVDGLEVPGQWPEVRAALDAEPDAPRLHARLVDLDPLAASRMDPANHRRVARALEVCLGSGRPFSSFGPGLSVYPPTRTILVGIDVPMPVLDHRIEARLRQMVATGLVDEVAALAIRPSGLSRTARQGLGYRQLLDHLDGALSLDEAVTAAIDATRRFARRQQRWFRRDPRVVWVDHQDGVGGLVSAVESFNDQ